MTPKASRVRVVTEGDLALVLAEHAGRWRPVARCTGPDAEAGATRLAAVLNGAWRRLGPTAAELLIEDLHRAPFTYRCGGES